MSPHHDTDQMPVPVKADLMTKGNIENSHGNGINGYTKGDATSPPNGSTNGKIDGTSIPLNSANSPDRGHPHVNGIADGFFDTLPSKSEFSQESYEPIAIIGCGMRLPGSIDTDEALWQLLSGKQDGRCRVPLDRYNVDAFYGPGKAGHVCTEFGHFLSHVNLAEIDSSFWSMTRKEIEVMDPQQRLALEVVYECLQSSGTTNWKGKDVGVFFGIYGEDWADMQAKEPQQSGMYRITGYGDFVVANRISYEFGFKGPSVVNRTACSSSLTALHDACLAIQRGECESAIAGGTNLIMNPHMTIAMAEQGVLSVDGECKTFDSAANGYVRGEGVVAVHVKTLSAAIRDNDPIRAVIRSSCTNSDGRTAGLALPNSDSHEALMRRSHKLAGLDIRHTAMIECHGTGTQVGDPLEASAVARVFGDYGIYIGSVKPNLGHSEGASGITSVIKAMLSLEKRRILPNINFRSPNKKIPFDAYDISVPTELLPWPKSKAERIGVNSFGIGGANAHVLLESASGYGIVARPKPSKPDPQTHYLLPFSAASAEALNNTIKTHEIYYQNHSDRLADLSYTLAVRREPLAHRAFCVVPSGADPNEPLQVAPLESSGEARSAIFVFTGQGAQYAQMAADLLRTSAIFQTSIALMENVLSECDHPPAWSLREELLKTPKETNLARAEFSQPCCTAVQVALVDVLQSWGVKPTAVVGHSSGEIAAAYASGVLSAADAIKVAYYRGIVSKNVMTDGAMAAVGLSRSQVKPHLRAGVIIGCENSPSSITLSGDSNTLPDVMEGIRAQFPEALVRKLRVDCAYHSHHMEPVSSSYATFLSKIQAQRPTIPFYSSVTGDKVASATLDASYWVSNLTSPVLFYLAVSRLLSDLPEAVLLEVGPHSALAGPLRQTIKSTNSSKAEYIGTLIRNKNASAALLSSVGMLFQRGVPICFDRVVPKGNVLTDLPKYAWHRQGPYWAESRLSQGWRQREFPKHDILGARVVEASEYDPTWRCLLKLDDVPWIRDHDISHDIVFPGAGYVAMAGEAIRQLTGEIDFTVREVTISNALVLVEGNTTEVITHFKPVRLTTTLDSTWYDFEIASYNSSSARWVKHAAGQARGGCSYDVNPPEIARETRVVGSSKWYSIMKRFGLNYGPRFQGMRNITAGISKRRAVASIDNMSEDWESFYTMHPCTIDFAFQLFSVAAFKGLSRLFTQLSVPTYIGELYLHPTASEILIAVDAEVTPRGAFFGDAVGISPDVGTVFRLKSLKLSPLTDSSDVRGDDPHAAVELVWKPDINLLNPKDLMHVTKHFGHLSQMVERMALACMIESCLLLAERDINDEFFLKFRAWLDRVYGAALKGDYAPVKDDSHIADMTSAERRSMIESLHQEAMQTDAWPISTAVYRIFHAIEGIVFGTTEALQVLLEDDLLARVYDFGRLSNFDEFFKLVAHQKPDLRILEVGAGTGGTTAEVLPALSNLEPYNDRNYLSYTFTDVSPGFFESAKERFQDYEAIEYRVLDIAKDPLEQGFEEGSFDVIVASNVLHATPNLVQTLTHCRKLLTPEGWLFLQELSPPTKWINFVMGVLPGWWLGEGDGRAEEPYLSPPQWEPYLRAAGFDGVQSVHHDEQFNATMLSRPTRQSAAKRVTILANDLSLQYVAEISSELILEYEIDHRAWGEKCPEGQDIIALLDLDAPFTHDMDEALYIQFKEFLLRMKDNGNGILWVTGSAQNACSDPRYGMFLGFARTLRTELELNLGTLELDRFHKDAWKSIPKVLSRFQGRASTEESSRKPDLEWAFINGEILTSRFHWTSVNQALAAPISKDQAKKLDIEKRGILSSLYWKQYMPAEPQGDYLRIRNYAVGLNFKDVLISMGIVEGTVVEGDGLGCESAGIVEKVGPEVKNLAVGDRCIMFASGAFATSVTTSEKVCVKIPDSLSFTDAASMATVYCTVIYSVLDKASLEKGQTILIHSACGGVGIAAMQICRALGAEIYCTVGSEEKVRWLMDNYEIPRDHIFNSRDQTFQRDILEATQGRGVDVVLNSLSGELLHASWQCVAEFGCMVEIGKRDLIGKGSLALDLFERNRSYFGVDFAQICGERPEIASRLLKKMMDFFNRGEIGPIHPITHFPASQIEDSMRFMQKGSHIGKVVVSLPEVTELASRAGKEVFQLRENASYLLVGGLGGLGQAVAVWMAEAGATELIFLSRSAGATETYRSFIAELEGLGCKTIMVQGSVANEVDVERSMRVATKPLSGVLQASMVLRDVAFPSMSFEDWKTVTEPKVKGTWNLHNVSMNLGLSLDFFLLFSSWSGLVGQWGQANYAAGNSFLDSFAQYRRNMGLAASTVDIGIMEDIGYVSRNAHVLEHFRTTSTHVLYEQDLLDSLHLMINRGVPTSTEKCQLAIGLRSTQPLSAPNNRTVWRNDPRMSLYFNTESQGGTTTSTGNDELRQFLAEAAADVAILDNEASTTYIATEIGKTLFAFLMRDASSLDLTESFSALGVDSLVSIELRNWFKQRLGCEITVLDILGSSSILALGQHTAALLKIKMTSG